MKCVTNKTNQHTVSFKIIYFSFCTVKQVQRLRLIHGQGTMDLHTQDVWNFEVDRFSALVWFIEYLTKMDNRSTLSIVTKRPIRHVVQQNINFAEGAFKDATTLWHKLAPQDSGWRESCHTVLPRQQLTKAFLCRINIVYIYTLHPVLRKACVCFICSVSTLIVVTRALRGRWTRPLFW